MRLIDVEAGARVLVTPKTNPDLDGVACAVAYAEFLRQHGVDAAPLVDGRPDGEARFALAKAAWVSPGSLLSPSAFVLVDASDVLGLPDVIVPERVLEVIDHRQPHQAHRHFPRARVHIELVGAAATLIAERWQAASRTPSLSSALLLQAAIHSNTQRLRGTVTTTRDVDASAWLADVSPLPAGFIDAQFAARAAEIVADVGGALSRESKVFAHPDGPFIVAQLELPGAARLEGAVAGARLAPDGRVMVNLVDVDEARSVLVVHDATFREWVASRLGVTFDGARTVFCPALLRKQIVARIHEGRP